MGVNYDSIRAQASAGIAFFAGENPAIHKVIIPGKISIVNGREVKTPETSQEVSGVIRDVTARDINGETILAGDKKGIFNHKLEIKEGMLIEVDGARYKVTDPRPIKPGSVVVAYRPILRRVAAYG